MITKSSSTPNPSWGSSWPVDVSIVMPCLNEAETLGECLAKAKRGVQALNLSAEFIVADNGSTDASATIAENNGARLVSIDARGYGNALRGGIAAARGRWVIMGDADASYDFSDLSGLVSALREGSELVIGNRFEGGIHPGSMPWLHRYVGNPVLSFVGRKLFGVEVHDFHCGLRGMQSKAVKQLGLEATGMEFATEMIVRGARHGLKISEVPVPLYPDGRSQASHLRTWRDGWRHLHLMGRLKWRQRLPLSP